jgi:heme-degrading monooxygenase HmoA
MLRMQTLRGREEDFEREWIAGAKMIAVEPGNLGQWLAKSAEEDGVYYIISDWVDEVRFREYERSQRHLAHRSRLHPYRATGSMTTMNLIHETIGTGAR